MQRISVKRSLTGQEVTRTRRVGLQASTTSTGNRIATRPFSWLLTSLAAFSIAFLAFTSVTHAQSSSAARSHEPGGEANLKLPDLAQVSFLGIDGRTLLSGGLIVCLAGFLFGLLIYLQLRKLPVHKSMRDISSSSMRPARPIL
jgi:K(+)-stimulated pyrophosphate-energized sodium pump